MVNVSLCCSGRVANAAPHALGQLLLVDNDAIAVDGALNGDAEEGLIPNLVVVHASGSAQGTASGHNCDHGNGDSAQQDFLHDRLLMFATPHHARPCNNNNGNLLFCKSEFGKTPHFCSNVRACLSSFISFILAKLEIILKWATVKTCTIPLRFSLSFHHHQPGSYA